MLKYNPLIPGVYIVLRYDSNEGQSDGDYGGGDTDFGGDPDDSGPDDSDDSSSDNSSYDANDEGLDGGSGRDTDSPSDSGLADTGADTGLSEQDFQDQQDANNWAGRDEDGKVNTQEGLEEAAQAFDPSDLTNVNDFDMAALAALSQARDDMNTATTTTNVSGFAGFVSQLAGLVSTALGLMGFAPGAVGAGIVGRTAQAVQSLGVTYTDFDLSQNQKALDDALSAHGYSVTGFDSGNSFDDNSGGGDSETGDSGGGKSFPIKDYGDLGPVGGGTRVPIDYLENTPQPDPVPDAVKPVGDSSIDPRPIPYSGSERIVEISSRDKFVELALILGGLFLIGRT